MFGKPIPDCGSAGAKVPSARRGTRFLGGSRPVLTHSSRSVSSARSTWLPTIGFCSCWQMPAAGPEPCAALVEVEFAPARVGRQPRASLWPILVLRVHVVALGTGVAFLAGVEQFGGL